jgi:drug/metabolite transporter (DMT)-like permease
MKTKPTAFLLFINATILTSFSQVMLKYGMTKFQPDILSLLTNIFLIIGIGLYGVAAVMVIFGLKQGELSVLYPVIATSYLWVTIFAYLFFDEALTPYKVGGVIAVISGVIMTGIGGRK